MALLFLAAEFPMISCGLLVVLDMMDWKLYEQPIARNLQCEAHMNFR